jgi:phosphatidate cytidylyltransferase
MMQNVGGAAPAQRRSDLATRAIAGVVMIAVAVAALYAGGRPFWLLATAAALLMMAEWAGLMRLPRARILLSVLVTAVVMLLAGSAFGLFSFVVTPTHAPWEIAAWALAGGAALAVAGRSARLGIGLIYVAWPAIALLFLRVQPQGLGLALWTLVVVWSTDIGAYFAGRGIGGPKLSPSISPNKTWAGLGGGVVAALIAGYVLATMLSLPAALLWLGAPMAVLAQIGDLFESWLKRRAGVKDSGRILPGHGGVLDRLDGLVPVAVAIALLLMLGLL